MNKYKVIADFAAAGTTIPKGDEVSEPREGRFMANEEILGEPILSGNHQWAHGKGYNFIHEGIYWNMPGQYLQLIQENVPGTPSANTPASGNTETGKPASGTSESTAPSSKPLLHGVNMQSIKNSRLTLYAGAAVGGAIGYKLNQSIQILPGGLNAIAFIGLGIIGGYWGTQKLVEKL